MTHFTYHTAIREIIIPNEPLNVVHERHLVCRGFYREKGVWVRRSYDKGPFDISRIWGVGMPGHPKPEELGQVEVGAS
ncbi:hypothetical protein J8F10_24390 [Gemmata sp. G18]|uniref:DUF1653 domain-containing protein n=1 Tax=Gemmata palustris TaxID=2822762 RepID=A0ABS5BXD4_9BACT|nr:hypothetical protein [Gemmata palustris]MBP3958401.1 hypothetical protein [Gemmata palustris]